MLSANSSKLTVCVHELCRLLSILAQCNEYMM